MVWALALQEYSFTVVYRRGSQNINADALSRWRDSGMATIPAAVTRADMQTPLSCILSSSETGPSHQAGRSGIEIVKSPCNHRLAEAPFEKILPVVGTASPKGWHCMEALYTWTNLRCSNSASSSSSSPKRGIALQQCHDSPQAGHQGTQKTLYRLRCMAYWVNMAQDVECHCRECTVCQKTKLCGCR